MDRTSFVKWSGMAGIVGSLLALLSLAAISILADSDYPYTYDGLDVVARTLLVAGVAFSLVFAVGFFLAYGRGIGGLGQAGLLVAFAGLLSLGVGGIWMVAESMRGYELDGWWGYFMLGLTGTMAGMGAASLAGITKKALPSAGSKLAAAGGLGGAATLLVTLILGSWLWIDTTLNSQVGVLLLAVFMISLGLFKVGLIFLGYALWSEREPEARRIDPAMIR